VTQDESEPVLKHDKLFALFLLVMMLASLGLIVFSLTHGRSNMLIVSDGKAYYVWARSIVLDGDIDFRNDYQLIYPPDPLPGEADETTPAGHVVNKYPIGLAIMETPGLLLGNAIAHLVPRFPADGISAPYQIAVTWSLILLYFLSFFLLYRCMLDLGTDRRWAFAFSVMLLLGTNLIYYVAKEPAMAHAAGVALLNILLFIVGRWGVARRRISWLQGLSWGALVGLFFLVRNTNLLVLPFLAVLVYKQGHLRFREMWPAVAGALAVAALQPLSLYFLWGRLQLSTYPNESFTAGLPGIVGTLLSHQHGLFAYHPWYAVLILFAGYAAVKHPRLRWASISALVSFLLFVVANGTWWCWWFGDSFGNRAFIEVLVPLSAVGALALSEARPRRGITIGLLVLMAVLVGVNLYLCLGYMLQAYPRDGSAGLARVYAWGMHWLH
jgi:hypothetical protein